MKNAGNETVRVSAALVLCCALLLGASAALMEFSLLYFVLGALCGLLLPALAALKDKGLRLDPAGAGIAALSLVLAALGVLLQKAQAARELSAYLETPEILLLLGFAFTSLPLIGARREKAEMKKQALCRAAVYLVLLALLVLVRSRTFMRFDMADMSKVALYSALLSYLPLAFCLLPSYDWKIGKCAAAVLLALSLAVVALFAWQQNARDNVFRTAGYLLPFAKGLLVLCGLLIKRFCLALLPKRKA